MAQPHYAPTPIRLQPLKDFTGGLNMRADAMQLGMNESPDLLDVSVQIGGGFVQRQVVEPYSSSSLPANPLAVWSYQTPSFQQVVVSTAAHLYWGTGAAWTAVGPSIPALPSTVRPRAHTFNYNLYVVFGSALAPVRWNGSTATSLTQTWNETIGTEGANDGNMPFARFICSHMGRTWIAYTTESGTDHPNRIRWSHPNFAEDWRQEDFIDIDIGRDGDYITGIVEFRDRLYIFKNNSISVLTGYGPTNFQVTTLSQDIGAVSQEAICVTDVGLFNFSWPQGVYLDRGSGPYPIFDKLYPLTRDGWIPSPYRWQISMGWVNQMLWVSVPWLSSTVNNRVLVYDPWIWKNRYMRFLQGPWFPYNLSIATFANLFPPTGQTQWLGANASQPYIGTLEQNGSVDNWGAGNVNINSYYKTRWEDLGQEAVFKRWRHPDFSMRSLSASPILVEVRKDYDPSQVYKSFQITPKVPGLGMLWDVGTVTNLTCVTGGTPGTTTYGYKVTALVGSLEGQASAEVTIGTGNATLSVSNFNTPSWTAISGATSYNVYGRTAGGENLLLGNTTTTSFNDTGMAGTAKAPPTTSAVGGLWDDGSGLNGGGQWSVLPVTAESIVRGGSMGSARAVQLSFFAPTGQAWGVDEITLKYIPKRVRG